MASAIPNECYTIPDSKDKINKDAVLKWEKETGSKVTELNNLDVFELLDLVSILGMDVIDIPWDLDDKEYSYWLRYIISEEIKN